MKDDYEDITGKIFNDLKVIQLDRIVKKTRFWKCECICKNEVIVKESDLKSSHKKSCGCRQKRKLIEKNTSHGMQGTQTYSTWFELKRNRNNNKIICNRWNKFENFFDDMGEQPPGLVLGKLNQEKEYDISNCKWMNKKERQERRSTNIFITYNNVSHTLKEWSDITGVSYGTIHSRYNSGLTPKDILSNKPLIRKINKKFIKKYKITGRPRELNKYRFDKEYCYGLLKDGREFIVDIKDYDLIKNYSWRSNENNYIETSVTINGIRKRIFIHRLICNVMDKDWKKIQIDHKNNNTLNNTRDNLRACSCGDNQINKDKPRKDSSSKITGIVFDKKSNKWRAYIQYKKQRIHLGFYYLIEDAIEARINAEVKYYGEFSKYTIQ